MNSVPNFDMKNPREYPTYKGAPVVKSNVSTRQRIAQCFNSKVVFWAVLTILVLWAFFEKPFVSSMNGNLSGDWLLFAGGLVLGISEGVMQQKRRATNRTSLWLRIPLVIAVLAASLIVVHFLGNNNFFFSLCEGGLAGSGVCKAIVAYRSNWATYR